mmetsp:Transcript_183058/g.580263  ORF Transcript_183058/g.580263 Transcript_183058/m.580263 type:complete len:283 (+) Transcript_183058:166-1014(+)
MGAVTHLCAPFEQVLQGAAAARLLLRPTELRTAPTARHPCRRGLCCHRHCCRSCRRGRRRCFWWGLRQHHWCRGQHHFEKARVSAVTCFGRGGHRALLSYPDAKTRGGTCRACRVHCGLLRCTQHGCQWCESISGLLVCACRESTVRELHCPGPRDLHYSACAVLRCEPRWSFAVAERGRARRAAISCLCKSKASGRGEARNTGVYREVRRLGHFLALPYEDEKGGVALELDRRQSHGPLVRPCGLDAQRCILGRRSENGALPGSCEGLLPALGQPLQQALS